MRRVKIGELKAQLSAYLKRVRGGEEVLVLDRETPFAKIVPFKPEEYAERERRLIARGILTPARKSKRNLPLPDPPGNVSDEVMEEVWRQERGEYD